MRKTQHKVEAQIFLVMLACAALQSIHYSQRSITSFEARTFFAVDSWVVTFSKISHISAFTWSGWEMPTFRISSNIFSNVPSEILFRMDLNFRTISASADAESSVFDVGGHKLGCTNAFFFPQAEARLLELFTKSKWIVTLLRRVRRLLPV